jgi:hypothetical protein
MISGGFNKRCSYSRHKHLAAVFYDPWYPVEIAGVIL